MKAPKVNYLGDVVRVKPPRPDQKDSKRGDIGKEYSPGGSRWGLKE